MFYSLLFLGSFLLFLHLFHLLGDIDVDNVISGISLFLYLRLISQKFLSPPDMLVSMIDLVVLASGGGTDFQSIVDTIESENIPARISLLLTNNPHAYCISRARTHDITYKVIDHRGKSRKEHETEMIKAMDLAEPDLIVLAGYMRILTEGFVDRYYGKMINIHPALLPLFGGPGYYGERVHKAVLESGMKVSGCSVHFVTCDVDMGPIIAQKCVPVYHDDTVESLSQRVLNVEHRLLPDVVAAYARGRVHLEYGKAWIE